MQSQNLSQGLMGGMNVNAMLASFSKMSPQQRQQEAMMHQNDPMVLSLLKYVDNQSKSMQTAQQAAQPQQPMPPVNQQVAQSIGQPAQPPIPPQQPPQGAQPAPQPRPQPQPQPQPQKAPASLPEHTGIGTLPAGGIGMAGGGIVAFADGGDTADGPSSPEYDPSVYQRYAVAQAQQRGLDSQLVDRMFTQESGYNPKAVSKKGAFGIGQLMPKTAEQYGITPDSDPFKAIDASLTEIGKLHKKYGGDPNLVAAAYNYGQGNLDKHLRAHEGQLVPGALPKETQKYLQHTASTLAPSQPQTQTAQEPRLPPPGSEKTGTSRMWPRG